MFNALGWKNRGQKQEHLTRLQLMYNILPIITRGVCGRTWNGGGRQLNKRKPSFRATGAVRTIRPSAMDRLSALGLPCRFRPGYLQCNQMSLCVCVDTRRLNYDLNYRPTR